MRLNPRALFSLSFILLALLALAACIALRIEETQPFSARQGVLDLRGHNLDRQASVDFGGEWAFYWQRLLGPEDFAAPAPPTPDAFLNLPGSWQGLSVGGAPIPGNGYATLRLTLLADPAQTLQALRIDAIYSAYRLWANGRLVAQSGRVGTSLDTEAMEHSLRLVPLPQSLDGAPLELVLQVSCFHFDRAGLPTLRLGRLSTLEAAQHRIWGLAWFAVGTLLLMGVYHIALFALHRKNPAPLFFGLYCLVWTGFVLSNVTSDWAIRVFFPELDGELLFRSTLFFYALAAPFSYHVFRSLYPQEFPLLPLQVFWALGAAYGALTLFAPTRLSALWLPAFHLVVLARALIFLWGLSRATHRGREGASIVLAGFLVSCLLSFNDILSSINVLQTPRLMHLGMLFFMLTQALVLARHFTLLFTQVEKLSHDLAARNLALEQQIAERSRLQREVVSISENERRRLSHELHDGLCQQLTGARLQSAALENDGPEEASRQRAQARLSQLLAESVDHAYRLSRGLWSLGPESGDIGQALSTLARTQSEASGIPIELTLNPACAQCSATHAPQIYGIAREAVVNAIKHARPQRIDIALDCRPGREEKAIVLCVRDDGCGRAQGRVPTDEDAPGLGLRIMSHRAQMVGGEFHIDDAPGGGTRITCRIPCQPQPEHAAAPNPAA